MEPDSDWTDILDSRALIEGRYSVCEIHELLSELIDNEGCSITVSRDFKQKYYRVAIEEDGSEWSESEIEALYNNLWENGGEKEEYLERIWK